MPSETRQSRHRPPKMAASSMRKLTYAKHFRPWYRDRVPTWLTETECETLRACRRVSPLDELRWKTQMEASQGLAECEVNGPVRANLS